MPKLKWQSSGAYNLGVAHDPRALSGSTTKLLRPSLLNRQTMTHRIQNNFENIQMRKSDTCNFNANR